VFEYFATTVTFLGAWNWPEIVKGIVSIWVATVATLALRTWKRQSHAQKKTEFMDAITESVHEFIQLIAAPKEMVKYVRIGIESFAGSSELDQTLENPEAVAYIQKRGKEDAKRLYEYLKPCEQPLWKIRSLIAKGQVFGFKNYNECQNACTMITWQYDRIQALCYMLGDPSLYWKNPKVQEVLSDVISLDPSDIEKHINEQSVKFLTFVKDNYQAIYK
jgi:hypothetical protein